MTRNPAHTRDIRRPGWAVGAALVAATSLPAFAEDVVDHLSLLDQTGTQVVEEVLATIDIPPGTVVQLIPESPHPANWLVARLFERALVARGYVVIAPPYAHQALPPAAVAPAPATEAGPATPSGASAGGLGDGLEEERSARDADDEEAAQGTSAGESAEEEDSGNDETANSDNAANETAGGGEGTQPGPAAQANQGRARPQTQAADAGAGAAGEFEVPLPERGEVLAYQVVECGVSYPWAKRTLLVGPRRYGRMVSVKLWASWISQPGHRVKKVAHSERVHLDSFPGWARTYVEGQGFPFTIAEPAGASFGKWIEPVIVAGIASGLVYLFYQNQK